MEIKLLSVIVPIYKQEKTIKKDLESIYETLRKTPYNFEVIGIVDGMNLDNSYKIASTLEDSHIKIYGYKKNKGKGQAVKYGMRLARGDVITFIDAGGDINPQGIVMLLEHMKWYDADIIIGSKMHPASKVDYPLLRWVLSYGYYFFVKMLFRLKVRDTQTGVKAYKRIVLENVLKKVVVKRYAFDIELLAVASKMGFKKIYDAPVDLKLDFRNSSILGISAIKTVFNFILDTLAIWYRMNILNYYNDNKHRKVVFDEDLNMWVNTVDMVDERKQYMINFVNKVANLVGSLFKKDTSKNLSMKKYSSEVKKIPLVSVIVPTKTTGYHVIFENLPAMAEQTYKNFEVILLPDTNDPYDSKLLEKYSWLKILPTKEITRPAEKRDLGAKQAQGEILAFLDADAYPHKDWLKNAVEIFNEKAVESICGPGIVPKNADLWERVFDEVFRTWVGTGGLRYRFFPDKERYVDDFPTMNFLVKRKVFNKLGGFNSSYYPGEDSKFCDALVNQGGKIFYHPEVSVYHHRRRDLES